MALTTLDFAGLTAGATPSTGNTGFDSLNTAGGTWDAPANGVLRGNGTTTPGILNGQKNFTASEMCSWDAIFWVDTFATGEAYVAIIGAGSTRGMALAFSGSDGKVRMRDAGNAAKWAGATTSTNAMTAGTKYRMAGWMTRSATAATFRTILYASDLTTVIEDTGSQSGSINTGSAAFDNWRVGPKASSGSLASTIRFDSFRFDPAQAVILSPTIGNPTVPSSPTLSYRVFIDMSTSTFPGGSGGTFSASPSTNVTPTATGVIVPANADGSPSTFTVTATDTATTQTASVDVEVALPEGSPDSGMMETMLFDGDDWV